MAFGVSTRTLFLLVRGVYMGRPLKQMHEDITKSQKAQIKWINIAEKLKQKAYRTAYGVMFEGVAFMSFGTMAVAALTKVMEKSREGAKTMWLFGRSIDRSLSRAGTALNKVLGPMLMNFANLLETITANEAACQGLMILATIASTMLIAYGAAKLLAAAFGFLFLKTGILTAVLKAFNITIAVSATTIQMAAAKLAILLAYASLVYMIVSYLKEQFGLLPAVIAAVCFALTPLVILLWKGAAAMSVLTWGMAAVAGLAGIMAVAGAVGGFQQGTTFVRKTGLAYVHAGEVIKSARESPDFGYLKTTGGPQRVTYNTVTVKIDTVHTKADFDDLDEKLRRAFKDYLEQKV